MDDAILPFPLPPTSDPETITSLETIAQRVLWLSTYMIHYANKVRPNPDGMKVGGHQASCASVVSLMTALYFAMLRPQDHVAVKPHASPVLHAIQYLLGRLPQHMLTTLRSHGANRSSALGSVRGIPQLAVPEACARPHPWRPSPLPSCGASLDAWRRGAPAGLRHCAGGAKAHLKTVAREPLLC